MKINNYLVAALYGIACLVVSFIVFAVYNNTKEGPSNTQEVIETLEKLTMVRLYNTSRKTGTQITILHNTKNISDLRDRTFLTFKYIIHNPGGNDRRMIATGQYNKRTFLYSSWYTDENETFQIKETN